MKVHCLFEQSGTFKNEFKKLGFEAYDYDIENRFGETDFQIDLFQEIENAVNKERSIFDNFTCDDLIFVFFPCIRFTSSIYLELRAAGGGEVNWTPIKKLLHSKKLNAEQSYFYNLFCQLFILTYSRGFRLIVENPYNRPNYLVDAFPIEPSIIDHNRTVLGDKFKKPTQYWFVNLEPKNNKLKPNKFVFGAKKCRQLVRDSHGIDRSLIEPKYAENFIKKYILESEVMPNDKKVTNP